MNLAREEILESAKLHNTTQQFGINFFQLMMEEILSEIEPPTFGITFGEFWNNYKKVNTYYKNTTSGRSALTTIDQKITLFNSLFPSWMKSVKERANLILANYFSSLSIQVHEFNFTPIASIINKAKNERFVPPSIVPVIKFSNQIERSYRHKLNEARLSALALSIYLGAISILPPPPEKLRILFLDDIFIGLDTSNRIPLLECLNQFNFIDQKFNEEKEEFEDYKRRPFSEMQILLSTYDRYWFELAKEYLPSSWATVEMYVEQKKIELEEDGTMVMKKIESPVIVPSVGNLQKAKSYLLTKDYPACGNYLRKTVEEKIRKIFQQTELHGYRFNSDGIPLKDLTDLLNSLEKYFQDCNVELPANFKRKFKAYKKAVLNPSSHDDIKSPIYKHELEKAFAFIKELADLEIPKRKLLVHIGQRLNQNTLGDYTREIESIGNLFLIDYEGSKNLSICKFTTLSWNCTSKGESNGALQDELTIEEFKTRTYHYLGRQDEEPNLEEFCKDLIIDTRTLWDLMSNDEEE